MFAAVNLARHHKVDAEQALRDATAKFSTGFNKVEETVEQDMKEMTIDELEEAWQQVKATLRSA